MKCYVLNKKLKKHYINVDNLTFMETIKYLKSNYGIGGYYLENVIINNKKYKNITLMIDYNEIRYFDWLC